MSLLRHLFRGFRRTHRRGPQLCRAAFAPDQIDYDSRLIELADQCR